MITGKKHSTLVWLLPLLALGFSVETPAHADELSDLRTEIDALRAEAANVAAQQRRIDAALSELQARLAVETASSRNHSSSTAGAPHADVTVINAAPSIAALEKPRVNVTGDFRLRGQGDYSDEDGRDHSSSQIRGRLGATYAVNERITLGARIVTGDPDDPNSADVQLSNFDDDLQVSLDQAYVQLNVSDLKLFGGKIPLPFTRTDLVWDGDVNPQGLSGVYKHALPDGGWLRASGLYFVIDEQTAAADSAMMGGQLGYDAAAWGRWRYDVSAAYYDYRLDSLAGADSGDFRSNLRNPDGSYRSDFNLADLIVGITWTGFGDHWPLRIAGDWVRNFGAATDADTAYSLDLSAGRLSRPGDWRITYGHAVAETDAVLAAFSHDNLEFATNYRLDSLTFEYMPFERNTVGAIWYHYKPDQSFGTGVFSSSDALDRLRLYLEVRF